ncbi:Lysophospholipase L1 [Nakamurella panacisegetis]|uniref:Lysophospholipase L1 n=1 Tax=Nakamurella panacisegetis TaxID=1090615 RepID=A0A1H0IG49_9ACTN|nr:SGNH/GDSL hydrolase family protein [Nakamurella panacisegetis]SDO30394.1 Lysophospholipase L1 [Nakamurella panacisegetis]
MGQRSGAGVRVGNQRRGVSSRAIVATAAGIGVSAGLVGAALTALMTQARSTVRAIERAAVDSALADGLIASAAGMDRERIARLPVPAADGVYAADGALVPDVPPGERFGAARPLVLAMLGDSTSVGYGTRRAEEVPGVLLARGVAAALDRPVRLRTHGRSGSGAADLPRQLAEALPGAPDLAVIVVGANDIRDKVPPGRSADHLGDAVAALRAQRIPVVVGTCPDFGVIGPIPQPLRSVLHSWSVLLATLQERAVLAAGGRPVAIGRLVSPDFAHDPELFAGDRFHPSGAGYAKAVAALLPVAIQELRGTAAALDGDVVA